MSKRAPKPEVIDKERQVLELRRTGAGWEAIAEVVGFSNASGAYKAYQGAIARVLVQPAEELRTQELDRLDRLQRAYWKDALEGNVRAADFILRVIDKRCKILGIEAPQRIHAEVVTYDGNSIDADIERIIRQLESMDQSIAVEMAERVSPPRAITAPE